MSDQVIYFYGVREPYGEFSNFAPYPITIAGQRWPTTEHYFQAQKFAGAPREAAIRKAASPRLAAQMGRDRRHPLRRDWEAVKDNVMLTALRAKFSQHPELAQRLLATGAAQLVEHTSQDHYWADGGDGTGRNRLGQLLMQVREELRKARP